MSVSNIEPDKDSLLKVCLFGKVEGIEMAGAASYSPVIQNCSYIRMEIMVQADMGEGAMWIAKVGGMGVYPIKAPTQQGRM